MMNRSTASNFHAVPVRRPAFHGVGRTALGLMFGVALFAGSVAFHGGKVFAGDDKAVSAPVLTVDGSGGSVGGKPSEYLAVTGTAPLGHSFGVQLDGALGQSGERGQGGLGGHVFWRDPNQAMVGLTTMWSRVGAWNIFRHGLEAEAYLDDYTLSSSAGIQRGDANKGTSSSGYGGLALSWYSRDDLKLALGGAGFSNSRTAYSTIEWKPDDSIPWTMFGVTGVGNTGPGFALLGMRYTFGNTGTSLKDRDRHGDPENIVSFTNAGGGGGSALTSTAAAHAAPQQSPAAPPSGSVSCFVAGTPVRMADGSEKAIETVEIGEQVQGTDGTINEVVGFGRPRLDGRRLYALNGLDFFVTADHPFLTSGGWKSLDPAVTNRVNPALNVTQLAVGDTLITFDGPVDLRSIESRDAPPETVVYNLHLIGNNTYVAKGFYVHNYGNGPTREQFLAGYGGRPPGAPEE